MMKDNQYIKDLEQKLQQAVDERNAAWFQLEENNIPIEQAYEEDNN